MRTIPGISHLFEKIDEIVSTEFIPALTGGIFVNEFERKLLSVPAKYGGLGIPIFKEICDLEYENSIMITRNLTDRIVNQHKAYEKDTTLPKKKLSIKRNKKERINKLLRDTLMHL